jgi:hypothetical protein
LRLSLKFSQARECGVVNGVGAASPNGRTHRLGTAVQVRSQSIVAQRSAGAANIDAASQLLLRANRREDPAHPEQGLPL